MSFTSPNGDKWESKKLYQKHVKYASSQKKYGVNGKLGKNGVEYVPSFGVSKHIKKGICPVCGRKDNLTCDWRGKKMCPNCYRSSL